MQDCCWVGAKTPSHDSKYKKLSYSTEITTAWWHPKLYSEDSGFGLLLGGSGSLPGIESREVRRGAKLTPEASLHPPSICFHVFAASPMMLPNSQSPVSSVVELYNRDRKR